MAVERTRARQAPAGAAAFPGPAFPPPHPGRGLHCSTQNPYFPGVPSPALPQPSPPAAGRRGSWEPRRAAGPGPPAPPSGGRGLRRGGRRRG